MLRKHWFYRRGDIYLAVLGKPSGSKQGGVRPVVVVQNNTGNSRSPLVTVVPLTSKTKKKTRQPTHYFIRQARGLLEPSVALAEQIETLDKSSVIKYIGKVSKSQMHGIDNAVKIQLGYDI